MYLKIMVFKKAQRAVYFYIDCSFLRRLTVERITIPVINVIAAPM